VPSLSLVLEQNLDQLKFYEISRQDNDLEVSEAILGHNSWNSGPTLDSWREAGPSLERIPRTAQLILNP